MHASVNSTAMAHQKHAVGRNLTTSALQDWKTTSESTEATAVDLWGFSLISQISISGNMMLVAMHGAHSKACELLRDTVGAGPRLDTLRVGCAREMVRGKAADRVHLAMSHQGAQTPDLPLICVCHSRRLGMPELQLNPDHGRTNAAWTCRLKKQ